MKARLIVIAAISAAVAAIAIVTIDQPVARWLFTRDTWPGLWNAGISVLEYAGGLEPWKWLGIAILVAGVLVSTVMQRGQRVWMFVTLVHLLTRTVVFWMKPLTGRLRPYEWITKGGDDTFFRDGVSFPSGHVGLFASVVIPLAVVFPRLRIPAAVITVYVMAARVAVDAHFVSDVVAGLALVCAITAACSPLIRPESPR
jgi:membrane-associated phospholipid phosphatase